MTRSRLLLLLCLSLAAGALNPALAGLIDAQQSRAETVERGDARASQQKSGI